MKTLVIERDALKHNISVVKERAGEAVIYAVLTGDGQGAGLVELARVLREEGIGRFAVSEVAEAAALRKAGFVEEEILMLRPTTDREELVYHRLGGHRSGPQRRGGGPLHRGGGPHPD